MGRWYYIIGMELISNEEADLFLTVIGGIDVKTHPVIEFSKGPMVAHLAKKGKTVLDVANERIRKAEMAMDVAPARRTPRFMQMYEKAKAERELVLSTAREIVSKRGAV